VTIALRYAVRSDIGLTRANNQDSAYAGPHLLVVADGMGGHAGGDIASSVAIAHLAPLDEETPTADEGAQALEAAVDQAHEELLERVEQDPDLAGLGTTITTLLRTGDRLILGHIGDSRAYLLRDGQLEQVTTDHTFVQYLVDAGRLEPEQAEHHPQRSLLLRVLGDVELSGGLDISVRKAEPGDRWLLCSDGLSGVVSAETLRRTMIEAADPDECADQLIKLALRGGGPDNVTCVVADILDLDELPDGQAPSTAALVDGAAATSRHRPTRGGTSAAAKAASLIQSAPPVDEDEPADARERTPVRRRIIWLLIILAFLALGAGGGYLAYRWSQTQYYVGESDGQVAIYQGIPQDIFGLELSHVIETPGPRLDTGLSESQRQKIEAATCRNITYDQARQCVDDAVAQSRLDNQAHPTPVSTPLAKPTSSPRAPASPSPTAEDSQTPKSAGTTDPGNTLNGLSPQGD
jgi:protein phosphatase